MALTPWQARTIVLAALRRRETGKGHRPLQRVKDLMPFLQNNPISIQEPGSNDQSAPSQLKLPLEHQNDSRRYDQR